MRERTKLGLWICLPLLAWVVVWIAALSMPASDCDGYGADTGAEEATLIVLVAVASLAAGAAALWRFVSLARADAFRPGRDLTLVGGAVASVLVTVAVTSRAEVIFVTGLVLTGLALLSLAVAWVAGLRLNQLGVLLPLYLLGAALFAYPLVGLLGLLISSGIGC
ncbi:MAG TPA: hypothetical protein VMR96_08985 [Solirubrobacterales bacterium]|nr:hypothetical protein [Solirubrobacterales bacterium]